MGQHGIPVIAYSADELRRDVATRDALWSLVEGLPTATQDLGTSLFSVAWAGRGVAVAAVAAGAPASGPPAPAFDYGAGATCSAVTYAFSFNHLIH